MLLYNILVCIIHRKTYGLYIMPDIQNCFHYVIKKHETVIDNPPIRIYVNKIEAGLHLKSKQHFIWNFKNLKKMKLLESNKSKITKSKNAEYVPHLEITKVVLVHCNIANNFYQQDSKFLDTFVPKKSFGELLDISPKNFIYQKTFHTESSYIEV